jgi:hypothetical protein
MSIKMILTLLKCYKHFQVSTPIFLIGLKIDLNIEKYTELFAFLKIETTVVK